MREGKFLERAVSEFRERQIHLPAVRHVLLAHHKFLFHQPIHQPHRAVVTDLQTFRQFPNRNASLRRKTFNRQQSLMLLRRHSRAVRRRFAEMHELAQRIAQVGQRFIFRFAHFHNFLAIS